MRTRETRRVAALKIESGMGIGVASRLREKSDSFSREVQSESSTPRPWFLLFHFLPSSAWADGNVAEAAVQLGKIVEHSKFKSTQPSPRPD